MASNLLELRKAAGYRNAGDFAEAHGIPTSTYTRYESNPNKIPLDRAWQLADILNSTIDVIVGREAPSPSCSRGNVQLEYDSLTPEARALADEFREFVLMKNESIKRRQRRMEQRPYEVLCYQYEQQMFAELRSNTSFGEAVTMGSAAEARKMFEQYLQQQAETKRGSSPTETQKAIEDQTIEKIMEAYDRTHGEFEQHGISVMWNAVVPRSNEREPRSYGRK